MLKQHVLSLQELEQEECPTDNFPAPLSFEDPESVTNPHVVTLALPWYDATIGYTFSAGTRFLKAYEQQDQTEGVSVRIFNPATQQFFTTTIPTTVLIVDLPPSHHEKIKLFVNLLTMYAHQEAGFIPYVLGGASFIRTTRESYQEKTSVCQNTPCTYYEHNHLHDAPKTGFDCSNLNHARAHNNGSGCVQEIPLSAAFKDIATCGNLLAAWRAGQPLERLGHDGTIIESITDYKLLSVASAYQKKIELFVKRDPIS